MRLRDSFELSVGFECYVACLCATTSTTAVYCCYARCDCWLGRVMGLLCNEIAIGGGMGG